MLLNVNLKQFLNVDTDNVSTDFIEDPIDNSKMLDVNVSYPYSDEFDYETFMTILDLDNERKNDILEQKGFIVTAPKPIQKELKEPFGIYSPKFGQSLSDANPFIDRYKCECGHLRSRINHGITCSVCNTVVKYVDDDYNFFGWLVLNDYYIIHPNLYKSIETIISADELVDILQINDEKDENGHSIANEPGRIKRSDYNYMKRNKKKEMSPYYGIGMMEFKDKFKEILEYYYNKSSNKLTKVAYYNQLLENYEKIFAQSIPVYTTHLRPFDNSDKKKFAFESTNGMYTMMSRLVATINNNTLRMYRKPKSKNQLLFDLQMKFNELNREIDAILSGKKGNIRLLSGGRCNFAARAVIVQDTTLHIDEVSMPYFGLVEMLQQTIINVLKTTYNMSYNDAYSIWYKANIEPDERVIDIINSLIASNKHGLPLLINRPPTICRGSILQVFCTKMTMNYTMSVSLQILKLIAGDFDGDVLSIFLIINQAFFQRAYEVMNPRNSMMISNNSGNMNMDVIPARDNLICANTLVKLGRHNYTQEQLDKLSSIIALQV